MVPCDSTLFHSVLATLLSGETIQAGHALNQALDMIGGRVNTKIRLRIVRKRADRANDRLCGDPPARAGPDVQVAVKDGKLGIETSGALPAPDFERTPPPACEKLLVLAGVQKSARNPTSRRRRMRLAPLVTAAKGP